MENCSIGIDIGGTKIASGLVTRAGKVIHKLTSKTPTSRTEILALLRDQIQTLTIHAKEHHLMIDGIGIGSAGQVSFQEGRIVSGTDNIKEWNDVPLVNELRSYTNYPIWLDNDANTFAIAEYVLGSAQGKENVICLTLGTGIGGGVIVQGELLHGTWGGAAELGHISVDMNGPMCNCGSRGCIEVYASGTGIASRMKEALRDEPLKSLVADIDTVTSKEVFQWHEEGNPLAVKTIKKAIEALSYGVVNLIHTFNPSAIVFGGGLIEANTWLALEVGKSIESKGMSSLRESIAISISELGYDTGLIGAACQVWFYGEGTKGEVKQ